MTTGPTTARRPYRSGRRADRARRTRQRVLHAAGTVFLARGYAGATMRAVAAEAGVSVPTLEQLFGTKARLLKAAIDVAIAGDDEPVPVLAREWTREAVEATTLADSFAVVAGVIGPAQTRAAGLVLAAFEGAATDPELAVLAAALTEQRATTAAWLVDLVAARGALRAGLDRPDAVDTVWVLMDPVVFERLTRRRHWSVDRYQRWCADAAMRLLTDDPSPASATRPAGGPLP